jgi:hypothetical protein
MQIHNAAGDTFFPSNVAFQQAVQGSLQALIWLCHVLKRCWACTYTTPAAFASVPKGGAYSFIQGCTDKGGIKREIDCIES